MAAEHSAQRALAAALLIASLAGCTTAPPPAGHRNVYTQERDSAPRDVRAVDYHAIPDAVPRVEPRGKYGNKSPYTVLGRTYRVLDDARGYRAEGIASWYGEKFQGFRTSSMETYDMYGMTAAHTTLPIPTWVRVTNLENGRQVTVKVNDRGPFHPDRLIDLSWAAAQKLGYAARGTARVRVEALDPEAGPATPPAGAYSVQAGAFAFPDAAHRFAETVRGAGGERVAVIAGDDGLHRVRLGPWPERADAERMRDLLRAAGIGAPVVLTTP